MNKNYDNNDKKIASALAKLAQVHRTMIWDVAKREGLSPIQIQFLIYLNRYPEEQRSVNNLAKEFDLTMATVSDAVITLEKKGLISKFRKEDDKRYYIIELTPTGKSMAEKVEKWQNVLIGHINRFPDAEKERVLTFLMELIKLLYDDGVISIARMCIACENFIRDFDNGRKYHYCGLTNQKLMNNNLNIGCEHYTSKKVFLIY